MNVRRLGLAALLLACLLCACTRRNSSPAAAEPTNENSVAAFLKNADRQAETDEQRKEIQRALHDMLDQSPAQLRQMRYADYSGQANAWTVTELLRHYFVPNPPEALDDAHFFQDVRAAEARAAIQHQLDEVTRALQ
jgi:hypothetical protein